MYWSFVTFFPSFDQELEHNNGQTEPQRNSGRSIKEKKWKEKLLWFTIEASLDGPHPAEQRRRLSAKS